jgi:hypothetical protein
MARLARVTAVAALGAVLAGTGAGAQTLPRLHVLTLGQHADRASVAVHEQFHVTIRLTVREKRTRFDDLILGDCANCSIVGDERIPRAVAGGTEYLERLTIEATAPGEAVISPAYIDAIDPDNGKRLRYSTNPVRVRVTNAPGDQPAPIDATFQAAGRILRTVVIVGVVLVVLAIALVLAVRRANRLAARAPVVPASPPDPRPAPAIDPRAAVAFAADALRRSRSERDLIAVRARAFEAAGVAPGATLVDALTALGNGDRDLRAGLLAAERAIFGPASERDGAIDDLLAALEAYSRGTAANEAAWKP